MALIPSDGNGWLSSLPMRVDSSHLFKWQRNPRGRGDRCADGPAGDHPGNETLKQPKSRLLCSGLPVSTSPFQQCSQWRRKWGRGKEDKSPKGAPSFAISEGSTAFERRVLTHSEISERFFSRRTSSETGSQKSTSVSWDQKNQKNSLTTHFFRSFFLP